MTKNFFNITKGQKKRKILFLSFLCFILVACSNKEKDSSTSQVKVSESMQSNDLTMQAVNYADSILTLMTLEEKVGQCLMPSIYSDSGEETVKLLKKYVEDYHIGGVVLLKGDMVSAKKLSGFGKEARVPLFIAIDAEWGLGMRLEDAKVYPKNGNIGKDTEETALFDYGLEIAESCKDVGINMVLGPVVDVVTQKGGVIGKRSFGGDPGLVSSYGVAYAKGLEAGGIISVAKHFPGHGSTFMDSHKGVAKIRRSISELDTLDLVPFRDYINSGLTGVMAGHIQAPALDPEGNAASVSIDILTSLLREEMGFKGLILTDAFDMGGAKGFSAAEALKAGADIILCPLNIAQEYESILENVKSANLHTSVIDDRCRRILFIKYLFLIR